MQIVTIIIYNKYTKKKKKKFKTLRILYNIVFLLKDFNLDFKKFNNYLSIIPLNGNKCKIKFHREVYTKYAMLC